MVCILAASGRYGSGAMGELESQATENLANALSQRGSELAYQNYAAERARQDAAINQAGTLAGQDYSDIQQLMNVGQAQENQALKALQSDIARYDFGQNQPQQKLQSYLSAAYGAPAPIQQTTTSSGEVEGEEHIVLAQPLVNDNMVQSVDKVEH